MSDKDNERTHEELKNWKQFGITTLPADIDDLRTVDEILNEKDEDKK